MYPVEIKTLGDHIRKKRLDLGLFQKDVAKFIGVNTSTITNWEKNRNQADFRHYPKITEFLGYCPFEKLETVGERLQRNRMYLGISQSDMAIKLGIDPTTLARWESNAPNQKREHKEKARIERAITSLLHYSIL